MKNAIVEGGEIGDRPTITLTHLLGYLIFWDFHVADLCKSILELHAESTELMNELSDIHS